MTLSDPVLKALVAAQERSRRRTDHVEGEIARLADMVTELADLLSGHLGESTATDADMERPPTVPTVRSWLLTGDPEHATEDLTGLIGWLDAVYLRYPDAALPSCWLWHPHVIEELRWCQATHADAYEPRSGGSWLRVADWHDRLRPGVVRRINSSVGTCELALHVPGREHAAPARVAPLAAHAAAVARAWTAADQRSRPRPTTEQLDEAEQFTRDRYRGR